MRWKKLGWDGDAGKRERETQTLGESSVGPWGWSRTEPSTKWVCGHRSPGQQWVPVVPAAALHLLWCVNPGRAEQPLLPRAKLRPQVSQELTRVCSPPTAWVSLSCCKHPQPGGGRPAFPHLCGNDSPRLPSPHPQGLEPRAGIATWPLPRLELHVVSAAFPEPLGPGPECEVGGLGLPASLQSLGGGDGGLLREAQECVRTMCRWTHGDGRLPRP